jgi:hypothetical protein
MVFPHRVCGFAADAAPIPVYGSDFSKSYSRLCLAVFRDKVAAGGTPAALATLADPGSQVVEDQVHPTLQLFSCHAPMR